MMKLAIAVIYVNDIPLKCSFASSEGVGNLESRNVEEQTLLENIARLPRLEIAEQIDILLSIHRCQL